MIRRQLLKIKAAMEPYYLALLVKHLLKELFAILHLTVILYTLALQMEIGI